MFTHKLEMDLACRAVTIPRIDVVQDDKYSRNLELTLQSGGEDWLIPEGCTAAVSYRKADGTRGKYDTLPDGTTAWSIGDNLLTVALAPQMLTRPGLVSMHVHLYQGGKMLSTFMIQLQVEENKDVDAESEDYIHMCRYIPKPETAAEGQFFRVKTVDEKGNVMAVEAVDAPDTRVPQFNLVSMGMPTVPVNGTPVHISGLDLTELFEAMMMGPVRITGALDFGVLPQIADDAGLVIGATVVNPTYTTAGFHCVYHVASSDQTITALVSMDFIYSSGTITAMAKADSNAAEVPYFDLSAMGLPSVPVDGTEVRVSGVDLTGIAAAMQKGPIRVSHDFIDGDVTFKVSKTVTPVVQSGYIFADGVVVNDAGNISSTYNLEFYPDTGTICAVFKPYTSSADVWETIIDYTVPEDCATVKLATDVNGNPFSLKKAVAYVVVERAADFATANAVIRPSFDSSIARPYNDDRVFLDGPPIAPTEDGKATVFSIEVEKGIGNSLMLRNYRINPSTSKTLATFPNALKTGSHEYERYDADTLLPKPTGIDAFNLGAYYTCIGAGTRIKVVGVRE